MNSSRLRVIDRGELVRKELDVARARGATVGFVPTMGSLHEGHLALIRRATAECDLTIVSIFVNPLQFDSERDLVTYPRNLASDLASAEAAGADLVFAPEVHDMYPSGQRLAASVAVHGLSSVLEGASRPRHFDGVATVVAKLFNLAAPCRAYFGEKDYQQLLIVSRLAEDLSFPVEVVACPTVREPDGLACSSRNARLTPEQRRSAPVLYKALSRAAELIETGERDAAAARRCLIDTISAEPRATLDYAEVVRPTTLEPLHRVERETRLLVAATFGNTRLIDNLGVNL